MDLQWMTAATRNPGWDLIEGRWEEIYREATAGDRVGAVDLFVTLNVLHLGWYLARLHGGFREAADRLAPIFDHPDIERVGPTDLFILRRELAYTLFQAGDEPAALAQLGLLIAAADHKGRALREAKIALLCFMSEQASEITASEALTEIVQEVVHRMKRRKVRRWLPDSKSYGDLLLLLHPTVPMKERQRIIPEGGLLG